MNMKERMKGRLKAGLKIEVEDKNEDSFVANGEGFLIFLSFLQQIPSYQVRMFLKS